MSLKTASISFCTMMVFILATAPASANDANNAVFNVPAGGQAPPAAAGGSTYSVLVARGLNSDTAEQLREGLLDEGFTGATARPASGGTYEVIIGDLTSNAQATTLMAELRKSGYTPESIVEERGATTSAGLPVDSVFRVQVAQFATEEEARQDSQVLVDEGFVNVDIVPENGRHILMLGTFNRREDAEALLSSVKSAGFAFATVTSRERLQTSSIDADADLSGLSSQEQAETRDVLAMAQKVETGEATAQEVMQLRQMIQQLTENQKAILGREESNRSADRDKIQRIYTLYRKFDQALKSRDFTSAEEALAEVRQIDPNDIFLENRIQVLERERSGGTAQSTSSEPGGRDSAPVDPAEIQRLINEGRSLQANGNNSAALAKFREVLALDSTNVEARRKVAELEPSSAPAETAADGDGINKNYIYGGIALALLLAGGLWLKSRGNRDAAPAASTPTGSSSSDFLDPLSTPAGSTASVDPLGDPTPVAASTATPTSAGFEGFGIEDSSDEEETVATPAPTPTPEPAPETSDLVTFDTDDEPAPTPAPTQPAPPPADDDVVSISFADDEPPAAAAPEPQAQPAGSALDADLESLLKGTFPGAADASAESSDAPEPTQPAPTSAPAATTIFSQDFASASPGEAPSDWRGEYDYASLTVVTTDDPAHEKCLKYEKPDGTGSATYHLEFPPAKGVITAQFDIRCDEKNKFLLGVYFEKDEDFKQSVHTIIHQLDPTAPASLRIQGAATPYELGTWRTVRYVINLETGLLNGYVDDEQVVTDAQLAVVPEFINTLSIRDNLATTGTMYLDNIRILEG